MSEKMRDSGVDWIGEIPEGWEVSKIKYVAELDPVKSEIIRGNFIGKKVTFLPMDKLKKGHLILDSVADFIEVFSSYNYFAEGDILFAKVTPSFENGNIGIAKNLRNGIGFGSSEIYTLRAHNIDTNFLYYWLQNQQFKSEAVSNMYGVAGLKRVPAEFIKNHVILLPISRIDQKAIADYLDQQTSKFDQAQKLLKDEIERLRAYKKSLIYETVTKGLDKNVQLKDSGVDWIGEIPVGWEMSKVAHFYDVNLGKMLSPDERGGNHYVDYFKAKNVQESGLDLTSIDKMYATDSDLKSYKLLKGDLLVTEGGDVARSVILERDYPNTIIQNSLHKVRGKNGNDNRWLYYILQILRASGFIDLLVNRATIAHFTKEKLDSLKIVLPASREEQKEISDYLDKKIHKINEIIQIKEKQLTNLSEQRKTLIYEVITGKRRISENSV